MEQAGTSDMDGPATSESIDRFPLREVSTSLDMTEK
jgi:hypothetical protein